MEIYLEEFKSNTNQSHVAVKDLSLLSVQEIETLIFNHVYSLKYMTKSKFISSKNVNQYVLGDKIVFIEKENDIEGFSLVLVHQHMNETQAISMINSDIKRFNSVMFKYFQDDNLDK